MTTSQDPSYGNADSSHHADQKGPAINTAFTPAFDLCEFRHLVAGYVKLLIRARWLQDPGFVMQDELTSWKLDDIEDDRRAAWQLVAQAASTLGLLNREFLPRCGSGGVRETDQSTPVGRLIDEISFFVEPLGGGPEHSQYLISLVEELREGASVDWRSVASWNSLQSIRDDLDLLPESKTYVSDQNFEKSIFRRKGDDFEIAYRGGSLQVYPAVDGFLYIAFLLENPGKRYSGSSLRDACGKAVQRRSMATVSDVSTSGGFGDLAGDAGTAVDYQTLEECDDDLAKIRDRINEAREMNDEAAVTQLEDERNKILEYVRNATNHRGKPRKVSSSHKNAHDSVRKAIKKALGKIKSKDSEAFNHFYNSLHFDDDIYYSPEAQIDWEIRL